jgi:hypothetical protein
VPALMLERQLSGLFRHCGGLFMPWNTIQGDSKPGWPRAMSPGTSPDTATLRPLPEKL